MHKSNTFIDGAHGWSGDGGRRTFLRSLAAAPFAFSELRAATPSTPNIVILLADDMGYGDTGVTGCPDIRTPSIDRLASEGVRFTHAYCNGPVCSPTRAALLTGRYQQRSGIDRVLYVNERESGLPLDAVVLPEVLKPRGYVSGLMGKWHLGYPKKYFPTRQGFDEFMGFVAGNIDYFAHTDRLNNPDLWKNESALHDPRYMTQLIADESIRFIDRHQARPFFLYAAFNAPHDPYQGPNDRDTAGNQPLTRETRRTRAVYRSMVECLDDNIGRILAHLQRRRLNDNTVVFFMSDNGGLPVVARNDPFRGFKGTLWEGGIRTPLLARWTGRFPAGALTGEMAMSMDLFPTCAALAGAELPSDRKIDGVNLLEVCRGGGKLQRDSVFFHYQAPKALEQKAMVQGNWKYLLDDQGHEHLFNLKEDGSEKNDLRSADPLRLARMKSTYESWLKDVMKNSSKP
jgi:arylsulfatase A-like enzyme